MSRLKVSNRTAVPQSPPQGPPESFAVYFKGSNVLVDPGFENFIQMSGGWDYRTRNAGVDDYVLPYLDLNCPSYLKYPNDVCLTGSYPTWCQTSGPYFATGNQDDQAWKVSVSYPRSGNYGVAWWNWYNDGIPPGELCPINPYLGAPFSARVEPGDTVTYSIWTAAQDIVGGVPSGHGLTFINLRFYRSDFSLIRVDVGTKIEVGSGATWAQPTLTTTAPPGSTYVRACVAFEGLLNSLMLWVDDAVLAVT